jgi:hypothetical protein
MLDMPQMIQTWKEVRFPYASENLDEMLIHNCRGVMVVDGRNGRNKQRGRHRLGQEQLSVRDYRVYEHRVGNECIGRGVTNHCQLVQVYIITSTYQRTYPSADPQVLNRAAFTCD